MVDLEDMTDEELKQLQEEFKRLHERHNSDMQQAPELIEDEAEKREAARAQ